MAYLERDIATGEQVAIKYIPRGSTVRTPRGGSARAAPAKTLGSTLRGLRARR